ncbi:MAG: type I DNA topoisomerase [Deltaproteobacteria bacterium]|jgi:DNA topoisomerase-1|nr:type I DNA topoisomerase [Deltaproteobacteria bacterium]
MKLLIVESPGKIKKIQAILGEDWKVAASVGHVRDLPRERVGVYPPDYRPQYEATERGQRVIADLKRLTDQAETVYLATDPDREGEAIAWHLKEALELVEPKRVTYTEITEAAINKAMAQPGVINDQLVRAQEGRRVLDRLVGYSVSPAVTSVAGKTLSAGRVQTPALRLVVEREAAIRNFKSVTHYGVELTFDQRPDSEGWKAIWLPKNWLPEGQEYFLDKDLATRIAALTALNALSYEEGRANKAPPPPFTTSTLQQAASNSLKLDPKQTMEIAQKLYEAGHITYMRTDSLVISEEAVKDIWELAKKNNWPLPEKPRSFKAKKGAQEAHEAIRPTQVNAETVSENELEQALYKLIWQRAMASQLADAVFATVKAALKTELDGQAVNFEAKGRRLLEPGWKVILAEDSADENASDKDKDELNNPVPPLTVGAQVNPTSGEVKTRKTSAPPRYTQAALIRDLEKRGIGRPSTYAAIMENISSRQYILANKKRQLESTPLGDELIAYLKSKFGFVDYEYTKLLEEKLDDIAMGKLDYLTVVSQANEVLVEELKTFGSDHGPVCPHCGQSLRHLVKEGPDGYNFWACQDRENCGAKFRDQNGRPGQSYGKMETTDQTCPNCGQPLNHYIKEEPNGYNFWACQDRENCGAKYKDQNGSPGPRIVKAVLSDRPCPECGQPLRHLVKEDPDGYNFWSCSDQTCGAKFQDQNGEPGEKSGSRELTDRPCPECGQWLRHLIKEGPDGYNFWACGDRTNCGAKFRDQNGEPGEKTGLAELTDRPCPECGQPLRHLIKEGPDGYNFWACGDRANCGAKFRDQNGEPGEKTGLAELTDRLCPECGQPLRHLIKEGPDGYNFWACGDRANCGAKFRDQNGEPGEKTGPRELTDRPCPECGQPLQHLIKEGPDGYNFWACGDRANCGAKFQDQNGEPGEKSGLAELTDRPCPECGQPLKHLIKEGPKGYNFWACSDRANCGATFPDHQSQPGEKSGPRGLTERPCPECGQPLQHLVKEGERGYNFWACSDRDNCGTTFYDQNDEPGAKFGQSALSNHKCARCGRPLRHLVKLGAEGYNFWACSDRENCGATYTDLAGEPSEKSGLKGLTERPCPECGQPLQHLVKEGPGGYNFWACSDKEKCGATFANQNDEPGEKSGKSELSGRQCPECGQPLRHVIKTGPNGYNFWACSDKDKCGATFANQNDEPGEKSGKSELSGRQCPECGQPLRHVIKTGPNGYNFWACQDRDRCGAKFKDNNDQPGDKIGKNGLSTYKCPECGQPMRHLVKEGHNGYNFWACQDREDCGAKFKDNNNKPGARIGKVELSEHKCPECGQQLLHLVMKGPNGYNFWGCPDRDYCGVKFRDNNGAPGEKMGKVELTDYKCPDCGQPLQHLVKEEPNGYNFWACQDRFNCGANFRDVGDKPGEKTGKRELTERKCPECGQPLQHIVKEGPDGYNFWACADRLHCGAKFRDNDGEPGEKNSKIEVTKEKCPDCGALLQRIIKDGPDGYNFWACSERERCGARFRDNNGQPGAKSTQSSITNVKCPECGSLLQRLIKEGPNGYNFWACADRIRCGATFLDNNGAPGLINNKNELTDVKCPDCGLPLQHIVKEGPNGYNFWACSDRRHCGSRFFDAGDKPGEKTGRKEITTEKCPDCGQPLQHIVKNGPSGYNFWACVDRDKCGARFWDENGRPGKSTLRGLNGPKCPECGQPLQHIIKEGEGGFDFWGCVDREKCGAKFQDNNGQPGDKIGKNELTEYTCQKCGRQLRHIVKEGPGGYNFWGCSDRDCGDTYKDDNGKPGEKNPPRGQRVASNHKCPICKNALYRKTGQSRKTGENYDFFVCSNRLCQTTFNVKQDKPVMRQYR